MNAILRARGVTLPEIAITLAIALILAGLAAPHWSRLIASNLRTAGVNQLLGAVQYARGEAIARNNEVVLCPHDGHLRCAASGADWPHGLLVFVNRPQGRPYQVQSDAQILIARRLPEGLTVHANRNAFVFRPLAVRSSNGTFRVCDPHRRVAPRAVIVSVSGRPRASARLAGGGNIPCPSDGGT